MKTNPPAPFEFIARAASLNTEFANRVIDTLCAAHNVPRRAVTSNRRTEAAFWTRAIAMYIIRQAAPISSQACVDIFKRHDHGSCLHAEKRIEERMSVDPAFKARLEEWTKFFLEPTA
jgi:chromosomal replication initiation ATPase DnaA